MIRVTGASGFIGQAVLKYCQSRGLPVTGYTRSQNLQLATYVASYSQVPANGMLLHLGEHSHIGTITKEIIESQVQVSQKLVTKKFEKALYVSSAAVYGPSAGVISVDCTRYSDSVYAQGKLLNEAIFLQAGYAVARLSNVYGPHMNLNNVIGTILQQRRSSKVEVYNTKPVRDYICVEDVAAGLVTLLLSGEEGIFHLSSGRGTSVQELISQICELSQNDNYSVNETMPGPAGQIVLDSSKTTEKIGWMPQVTLTQGLRSLIGNI